MAEQPPKYTYTPFPQSTSVHPLRPYYIPTDTNHYYTPSIGNSGNSLEDKLGGATKKQGVDSDSTNALKELSSFAFLKFFSTAFAQPFEVAKTLLQVQYLPNEDVVSIPPERGPLDSDEDLSDDDQLYKAQPSAQPLAPNLRQTKPSDNQGYLLNTDIYDESTRPNYMLPPLEKGVWDTVGALRKHPTEGYRSLWKGQFTNWIYEMAHLFLQPTVEGILNDTFDLYDDTIPLVYLDRVGPNIATLVTSHVVTGVLLSPLETVRTRLIVQTASFQKKYNGPFDCLRTMVTEEGFSSLYWSHNLLPSIVHHAIGPLIECSIPLIIDRIFHISPNDSPFLYGLARLGLQTLQLLIVLPIETIRKRLQCQIRSRTPGKRFETVVQMRQAPYVGMVDCLYRVIMEEGISQQYSPNQERRRQRSWFDNYGISSLYGGFEMHFISNIMMFLVTAINGVEDDFEDL